MESPSLGYAPTPPADRPHLVRQGDDFTLTLPPRVGWRTAAYLAMLALIVALLVAAAVWPPGVTRIGSTTFYGEGSWMDLRRVLCALCGLVLAAAALRSVRLCRTWTVIEVHGDVLLCTTPGAFKAAVTERHELAALRDARVVEEDGSTGLELEPRLGGHTKTLVGDTMGALYRRSDLEFAAGVIREAIASRPPRPEAAAESQPVPS